MCLLSPRSAKRRPAVSILHRNLWIIGTHHSKSSLEMNKVLGSLIKIQFTKSFEYHPEVSINTLDSVLYVKVKKNKSAAKVLLKLETQGTYTSICPQSFYPRLLNTVIYSLQYSRGGGGGGLLKNAYELVNLRANKFPRLPKIVWVSDFFMQFQRYHLKFHTIYLTHTLKDYEVCWEVKIWGLPDLQAHMPFWKAPQASSLLLLSILIHLHTLQLGNSLFAKFSTPLWHFRFDIFNTLRLRHNGHHSPDDLFKCIFLKEKGWILNRI